MDRGKEFSRLVAIELSAEGKRRGITHKQLATAAGITPGQVSYYIAGTKGDLTVATLVRAAERLGIAPEIIVERAYAALGAEVVELRPRGEWDEQQRAARHSDAPKSDDDDTFA